MTVLGSDKGITISPQGLHVASTVQSLRLGTKWVMGDRVFKYAKAGGTMIVHRAVAYYDYGVSGWAVIPTATPAGSNTVYATIGASEGVAGDGALAEHELEGAWIVIFRLNAGASNTDYTFQILDNTAVDSGGGTTTLTIASELPYEASTSAYTEITGNIYSDVRHITNGSRMFVGQPMIDASAGEFLWLQTWGPTWLNPEDGDGSNTIGNAADQQQLVFESNGSVILHGAEDATTKFKQHAGCVITRLAGGAETQGTPLIFLKISC